MSETTRLRTVQVARGTYVARCEDYPCCGHGPAPLGDGGGCPRTDPDTGAIEAWPCAQCGAWLPRGATSSLCGGCLGRLWSCMDTDCPGCPSCSDEPFA